VRLVAPEQRQVIALIDHCEPEVIVKVFGLTLRDYMIVGHYNSVLPNDHTRAARPKLAVSVSHGDQPDGIYSAANALARLRSQRSLAVLLLATSTGAHSDGQTHEQTQE
jgi:hypothetical protein